jgi:3-oxoacyl-[acyl-carrier protein] reductase
VQALHSEMLKGKVALVTGASRRIGRATVLNLARHGADVVVHARVARHEVEAVAEEARALGARALVHLADVTDEEEVRAMMDQVSGTFGGLDILVNNAAVRRSGPFLETSVQEWREIIDTILTGAFLCSQAAIPLMRARGGGAIVNIGGVTAHVGAVARAHVSAAKAGIVGLTRALAVEFAADGIRVNCVAPGRIGGARSGTSGAPAETGSAAPLLARQGEVEEAAAMVCTMCLPLSGYMTGQTVHVSGGMYMN